MRDQVPALCMVHYTLNPCIRVFRSLRLAFYKRVYKFERRASPKTKWHSPCACYTSRLLRASPSSLASWTSCWQPIDGAESDVIQSKMITDLVDLGQLLALRTGRVPARAERTPSC